jgi:hypothetical protein
MKNGSPTIRNFSNPGKLTTAFIRGGITTAFFLFRESKFTKTMQAPSRRVVCLSILITAFVSLSASAQIFEMREYHGKQIGCGRSGLIGWYKSCGTDAFYSQIFLGTVQTVKPIKVGEFEEFRLVLQPEEVFQGDVPPHFEVTTSQGECLPEIHAGDRWLFFIYTDKDRGPQLAYGHDSAPVAKSEERLARLRRLVSMPDAGIIMGRLSWGWGNQDEDDHSALANRQISLTAADGKQHGAFTNPDGHFEFDPLPVGKYRLTLNKAGLWTDDDGAVTIKAHDCEDYLIKLDPDGVIAGRVTEADGKPVAKLRVKIVLTGESNQAWALGTTDAQGRFTFHGVRPGHYLVGLDGDKGSSDAADNLTVLFPGVTSKEAAVVVNLGNAEHREDINILIPPGAK